MHLKFWVQQDRVQITCETRAKLGIYNINFPVSGTKARLMFRKSNLHDRVKEKLFEVGDAINSTESYGVINLNALNKAQYFYQISSVLNAGI